MSAKPEYDRGFRDGYRWAITWLHQRARELNDPSAKAAMNTACFHMGVEAKELRQVQDAGYRILGPDELDRKFKLGDRVTKTKGSSWTGHVVGFYSTSLTPVGYCVESENEPGSVQIYPEAAIRSLIPAQPEAKEANSETWPNGCHAPRSCIRHMACMYVNCRYDNLPIKADIEAALKAKEARDGR